MTKTLAMNTPSLIMLVAFTSAAMTVTAQEQYVKYIPAKALVAGFQEGKEFRLNTYVQTGLGKFNTGGLQGGIEGNYAPANYVSLGFAITTTNNDEKDPIAETGTNYRYGSTLQFAITGFTTIGEYGRFELAAGFTSGKVRGERWQAIGIDSTPSLMDAFFSLLTFGTAPVSQWEYHTVYDHHYYTVNYTNYFIQPAIGLGNDYATVLVGARLSSLNYNKFRTEDNQYFSAEQDAIDGFMSEQRFLIQPFVQLEAGGKYVKINTQAGMLHGDGSQIRSTFYASLGLTVHLAPRYTEKRWY